MAAAGQKDESGSLELTLGQTRFALSQQAPRGLFATTAPAPLEIKVQSANSLLSSHAANAYITFENRALSVSAVHYLDFFTRSETLSATVNSLLIALVSTGLAALIGVSLPMSSRAIRLPAARALSSWSQWRLVSPPFLGAYAWRLLLVAMVC